MSTQESLAVYWAPHQEGHIKAVKYKWMRIEMLQCPYYRGHIMGTAKQQWLNSEKWLSLPFHCRRRSNSTCSMPKGNWASCLHLRWIPMDHLCHRSCVTIMLQLCQEHLSALHTEDTLVVEFN